MHAILIAGFWLDGSSWASIVPRLKATGFSIHTPTLPGLVPDADRSGIGLADHIAAVVELVDALDGTVVLVGHSGGGAIAWGVADARPDRVARIVFVDSGPLGQGRSVNDELPVAGDEIPLPDWSVFEGSLDDFDEAGLAAFRARAIPQPARVATDGIELHDERRFGVPVTVVTTTFPRAQLEELMTQGHPYFAEFARVRDRTIVELPTSHWPQFTKPAELAELIAEALDATTG